MSARGTVNRRGLQTRSPLWELYFLYPRSDEFQAREIEAMQKNKVSLILLNRKAAIDGRADLRIEHTNPKLVAYIVSHYQRSDEALPEGFEIFYSPPQCGSL